MNGAHLRETIRMAHQKSFRTNRNLLRRKATQLTLSHVAGVLILLPDLVTQDLRSHLLDRLGGEQWEWLRDADGRHSLVVRVSQVLHRVGLRGWLERQVLLWVEGNALRWGKRLSNERLAPGSSLTVGERHVRHRSGSESLCSRHGSAML